MRLHGKRPNGDCAIFAAQDVLEVISCPALFFSPLLAEPVTALAAYQSQLLPIQGPIPSDLTAPDLWVVVFQGHGEIIQGVPELTRSQLATPARVA